jgi:hypothetical protein
MTTLSTTSMCEFLRNSISSMNANKLNGLLAEVDLRNYLSQIGFAGRVSPGGWIARRVGAGDFGHETVVLFPEVVTPGNDYSATRQLPNPSHGLHTICATFHQAGIRASYCAAVLGQDDVASSLSWKAVQLGLPTQQQFAAFPSCLQPFFSQRTRKYNFLRYHTDTAQIPLGSVPEEFSKEHLRVAFQNAFMAEVSDVDGIFWGQQFTYPLEIKEKTPAKDTKLGEFFGLDIGPFVKLAFYAAKRGNLHSLFIVREINNVQARQLVNWWYITYDDLAQYASWVSRSGGTNMQGGGSSVVKIPKAEFKPLNAANLATL